MNAELKVFGVNKKAQAGTCARPLGLVVKLPVTGPQALNCILERKNIKCK